MRLSNFHINLGALAILALLLIAPVAWGATVDRYVDCGVVSNGDGTISSPWKGLGDINYTSGTNNVKTDIDAGNPVVIHLKKGCTWGCARTGSQEYIFSTYGGTSDSVRLTYRGDDWGTGANAIIDNFTEILSASWTADDPVAGTYSASWDSDTYPAVARLWKGTKDVAGMLVKGSAADALTAGQWFFVGAATKKLYYKPTSGSPGDANNRLYTPIWGYGATPYGKHYITYQGISVTGHETAGIYVLNGSENINIRSCTAYLNSNGFLIENAGSGNVVGGLGYGNEAYGNYVNGGIYSVNTADVIISYNNVHHNGNQNHGGGDRMGICCGLEPTGGDNCVIEHNDVWANGPTNDLVFSAEAVQLYKATNSTVRYNYVHDNNMGGIQVGENSDGALVHHNLIVNNGLAVMTNCAPTFLNLGDLRVYGTATAAFYNNTAYGNKNQCTDAQFGASLMIQQTGASSPAASAYLIKNNIFSTPANGMLAYVQEGRTYTGSNVDYNRYDKTGSLFKGSGSAATTFAGWKTLLAGLSIGGADAHSTQKKPYGDVIGVAGDWTDIVGDPTSFVVTGTLSPDATGTYNYLNDADGDRVYKHSSASYYLRHWTTYLMIAVNASGVPSGNTYWSMTYTGYANKTLGPHAPTTGNATTNGGSGGGSLNRWYKNIGSVAPTVVTFNGSIVGTSAATPAADYQWSYTSPNLTVYATSNPASYYTSINIGAEEVTLGNDYKLVAGSPAIDKGTAIALLHVGSAIVGGDAAGNTKLYKCTTAGGVDIGALEKPCFSDGLPGKVWDSTPRIYTVP